MIQQLKNKITQLRLDTKATESNRSQFETNIKNKFISKILNRNLDMIEKHFDYIGKEVHAYKKSFSVTTIGEYDKEEYKELNPILPIPFIYSREDFESFKDAYTQYQIARLSNELTTYNLYSNSTDPFANLEHQWTTESKQVLIEFYKDLLTY